MNGFKKVVRDSFRKITLHAQEQAAVAQTMKANVLAEKQMWSYTYILYVYRKPIENLHQPRTPA